MKGTLFLTSAGLPQETRHFFLDELQKSPTKTSVAFIPTAADPEEDKRFLEKDKNQLKELGFAIQEVDLKEETEISLATRLSSFDVIWVDGGNTFYLLDWVTKSGFDKILPKLLDQGKIYVGVSAGSILMGPNIELAGWKSDWDKNIVGLKDLSGLNLVPFAISPHYTEKDIEVFTKGVENVSYQIVGINDRQAILVVDEKIKVVGKGKEVWFNKSKDIRG